MAAGALSETTSVWALAFALGLPLALPLPLMVKNSFRASHSFCFSAAHSDFDPPHVALGYFPLPAREPCTHRWSRQS